MKDKLLIIGAGGHGKVVADVALKMGKWKEIAFLDDNQSMKSSMDIEVIGKLDDAFKYIREYDIFVGIGDNVKREKIIDKLNYEGANIPTLIHPNAIIGEEVNLGIGTVIMAGAVINCCTRIGNGCIINTGATVDHDNIIEDFVHISPGVHTAGGVKVGKRSWLGIGSVVINNIYIIDDCKIGAGAVVIKDITESGTYVGVPARRAI
jgi:sugar O-acyltransferase (sialic acid O-acetyltransferase NeuD family)